jgi:8-oxo-dGTP pyrophosphatase MutT (NUDIX family)
MEKKLTTFNLASAVPYRVTEEGLEILLVTSRGKQDWIFPKGRVEIGDLPHKTAEREAFEEAGILGYVFQEPFGSYPHPRPYGIDRVEVFLMSVQQVLEDWPEKTERKRKWVPYERLSKVLKKEVLTQLIPEIQTYLKSKQAAA